MHVAGKTALADAQWLQVFFPLFYVKSNIHFRPLIVIIDNFNIFYLAISKPETRGGITG